jgi:hypothetical protein
MSTGRKKYTMTEKALEQRKKAGISKMKKAISQTKGIPIDELEDVEDEMIYTSPPLLPQSPPLPPERSETREEDAHEEELEEEPEEGEGELEMILKKLQALETQMSEEKKTKEARKAEKARLKEERDREFNDLKNKVHSISEPKFLYYPQLPMVNRGVDLSSKAKDLQNFISF